MKTRNERLGTASLATIAQQTTPPITIIGKITQTQETELGSVPYSLEQFGFDIDRVTELSKLTLSQEEKDLYSRQISKILDFLSIILRDVNTENVEPTFNVTGQNNVFRGDETAPSLSQEKALSNASKKKDGMFETKGVFEEE